jgi:hypothetical protein
MHRLWTLPDADADFTGRWHAIETAFSKSLPIAAPPGPARANAGHGSGGIESTRSGAIAITPFTWTTRTSTR